MEELRVARNITTKGRLVELTDQTFFKAQNKRSEDVNKLGTEFILILEEEENGQEREKFHLFNDVSSGAQIVYCKMTGNFINDELDIMCSTLNSLFITTSLFLLQGHVTFAADIAFYN